MTRNKNVITTSSSQEECVKISVVHNEIIVTSAYGIGQWVSYETSGNLVGKIIGITWKGERPILIQEYRYVRWEQEWSPSGFFYQVQERDNFEDYEEVHEEDIIGLACPDCSSDFESIRLTRLKILGKRSGNYNRFCQA